jgi:hypothetical protein
MKHLIAFSSIAIALAAAAPAALAQSAPPTLPELTPQQSNDVRERIDAYRRVTDARVARGEITTDEASRLVQWREWQLAQQAAGLVLSPRAPVDDGASPPGYHESQPPDLYTVEPAPIYAPDYRYPAPYYWGPRPYYYWGPSVCAGGFGRHFGARICV